MNEKINKPTAESVPAKRRWKREGGSLNGGGGAGIRKRGNSGPTGPTTTSEEGREVGTLAGRWWRLCFFPPKKRDSFSPPFSLLLGLNEATKRGKKKNTARERVKKMLRGKERGNCVSLRPIVKTRGQQNASFSSRKKKKKKILIPR